MPQYEYRCEACQTVQTMLKTISDIDKPEKCPLCKKPMPRIISSSVTAKFVGSGFHCNDYKP